MKILSVMGALGIGMFAAAWLAKLQRTGEMQRRLDRGLLNINQASAEELMSVLGLDAEIAERIVEHRPYPTRLDLLGRMVVPEEIYLAIKDRIAYKAS